MGSEMCIRDSLDELLVANLFGVAASTVLAREKISELLVLDQVEVVQYSDKLLTGDKVALGPVVILERRLDEDPLALDGPPDIIEDLL